MLVLEVATAEPSGQDYTVESVTFQNEQARQRLRSCSYSFEYAYDIKTDGVIRHYTGSGRVVQHAESRWSSLVRIIPADGTGSPCKQESRLVVNSHFLAFWPQVGSPIAHKFDLDAVVPMTPRALEAKSLYGARDYLLFAFGDGEKPLRESGTSAHGELRPSVIEAAEGRTRVLFLRRFSPVIKDAKQPSMVFTIDPSRDFAVVECRAYDSANGRTFLWHAYKVELEQNQPTGLWRPSRITAKWFFVPRDDAKAGEVTAKLQNEDVERYLDISIADFVVDPAVEKSQFDLNGLGLSPATRVIETDLNGATRVIETGLNNSPVGDNVPASSSLPNVRDAARDLSPAPAPVAVPNAQGGQPVDAPSSAETAAAAGQTRTWEPCVKLIAIAVASPAGILIGFWLWKRRAANARGVGMP